MQHRPEQRDELGTSSRLGEAQQQKRVGRVAQREDRQDDEIALKRRRERERRAVIIKAEGEVAAAANMAKAADILTNAPGALHLRTLQSINDISSDQSNTVVFAVPLEILRAFEQWSKPPKSKA